MYIVLKVSVSLVVFKYKVYYFYRLIKGYIFSIYHFKSIKRYALRFKLKRLI